MCGDIGSGRHGCGRRITRSALRGSGWLGCQNEHPQSCRKFSLPCEVRWEGASDYPRLSRPVVPGGIGC